MHFLDFGFAFGARLMPAAVVAGFLLALPIPASIGRLAGGLGLPAQLSARKDLLAEPHAMLLQVRMRCAKEKCARRPASAERRRVVACRSGTCGRARTHTRTRGRHGSHETRRNARGVAVAVGVRVTYSSDVPRVFRVSLVA